MAPQLFTRGQFTWLAYLMLAFYAYLQASLGPLMPFLRTELTLDYTLAGFHFSAFALGMVVSGLLGDKLARKWGRWVVFWGGAAGMALGALLLILGHHVSLTITAALVMGTLGSSCLVMIQAGLSDHHGDLRSVALTEANIGASISAGLAPILIGTLERVNLNWRLALLLPVGILILLATRFANQPIPRAGGRASHRDQIRVHLPGAFWVYWAVVALGVAIEWSLVFWGADFLVAAVGLGKSQAATIMGVFFLASVIGRVIGSRLVRTTTSGGLLLAATGAGFAGFGLFWLSPIPSLNVIGLFVAGLGVANFFPLTLAAASSVAPELADIASARIALAGGLAILLAPLTVGWAADQTTIQNAYGIVALLFVVVALAAISAGRMAADTAAARSST